MSWSDEFIVGYARLLNLALHGATLISRFLLVFVLAKYLDPVAMGRYGLFAATVGYALYFVGMDFYAYVTREIIITPSAMRGKLLKGQLALSAILYLFFSPISLLFICVYSDWPMYMIVCFIPMLLLEHFNQEASRLFVAMSEQICASVVIFVRQGSWVLVAVFAMYWIESSRHLATVIILWGFAGIVAAGIAIYKLNSLGLGGWNEPLDWSWLKRGIVVSISFLVATLALRGFQTVDRYWIAAMGGIEIVGSYVVFVGVAGSLLVVLDASVFSFAYPLLIQMYRDKKNGQARRLIVKLVWITTIIAFVFSIVSWMALPRLLVWIGRDLYIKNIYIYPWLLLATIVNVFGLIPHYALYALGRDRQIIFSHLAAFFLFALTVVLLKPCYGLLAVPKGLIAAFFLILLWKSVAYLRCKERLVI